MRSAFLSLVLVVVACRSTEKESPWVAAARACAEGSELSCVRPIFNVHSLREAQRYYRDALGFKLDWEHGQPPDFASMSRGDAVIFMCQGCQGNPGTWVMVFSSDVDALHAELLEKGALIRMPPTNMPWGMREMHVSDSDGNVLRFGTGSHD